MPNELLIACTLFSNDYLKGGHFRWKNLQGDKVKTWNPRYFSLLAVVVMWSKYNMTCTINIKVCMRTTIGLVRNNIFMCSRKFVHIRPVTIAEINSFSRVCDKYLFSTQQQLPYWGIGNRLLPIDNSCTIISCYSVNALL